MDHFNYTFKQCVGPAITVSQACYEKFEHYAKLLQQWNGLDLIAKSTVNDIFGWHINDCFSIANLVAQSEQVIDFGAGGGVLGVPLVCYGLENVIFVERNKSKAMFLRDIMKMSHVYENYDFASADAAKSTVVVRGVGKIEDVLDDVIGEARSVIFLKAWHVQDEIADALQRWDFDYDVYKRVAKPHGKVVMVYNIKRR